MKGRYALTSRAIALSAVTGLVLLFVSWSGGRVPEAKATFHSAEDRAAFKRGGAGLPGGQNTYFLGSGECYGCHGPDPMGFALVDEQGTDVNMADQWRSTMMANSARDPFWRAKVSHEGLVNPQHQEIIEDKCTSCHAPQGRYEKHLLGLGFYSINEMVQDPIALDGVSCMPCHMQSADSLGKLFSGKLKFDPGIAYGPYEDDIFSPPMISFVGVEPMYGEHINAAGLCAGCHTLITETVDLEGNFTGDHFVEQATYHEWLNSIYNTDVDPEGGVTCQGCHMPRITDAVVISGLYAFLEGRSPYGMHHFAGSNVFMLELLKNNISELGLTASPVHFDSTIARTNSMLKQHTLLMDLNVADRTADTAFIDVSLINLAGHKFPSGYPARRAFVELVVLNAQDDTLFASGRWNSAYEVEGHDEDWEPHHDVIRSPDQAQIYEMVMGDVNGDKTTVLLRAKEPLKDNRLAPTGFSTLHPAYDTTLVAGVPSSDIDFNRDAMGVEGSGSDIVHYHVPMNGHTGFIRIEARVWYQAAPPGWNDEMFAFNSPEIDQFRDMYNAADGTPVLVKEAIITDMSVGVDDIRELGVRIFPNPVVDGMLRIDGLGPKVQAVSVYDMNGRLIERRIPTGARQMSMRLPQARATYMVVFETRERNFVERVVSH